MGTVVMIFILPVGLGFLYVERKNQPKYQAIFDTFIEEVDTHEHYTDKEKLDHIARMFQLNNYTIERTSTSIEGRKRLYSVGAIFVGLGFVYIGALLYILYIRYIKKPHIVRYDIEK